MSYDIYLWHQATAPIDEVFDALAEQHHDMLVPHPSIGAFHRDVLAVLPRLSEVIESDESPSKPASYMIFTLPFGWTTDLPQILDLAARHELKGWDPQTDQPIGQQEPRPTLSTQRLAANRVQDPWTVKDLSGLGIGTKSLTQAWTLAELGEQVTFGEAVGAYILAMATRDGNTVDSNEARQAVAAIAADCAHGIPTQTAYITIGYSITDVTGFAQAVAEGHF